MERINYAAGSVLTGDRLAHAIVEYGRALAKNGDSDAVSFPVLLDNGEVASAEVLIGPASQVLAVAEPTDHDDIVDEDIVAQLVEKTAALSRRGPVAESLDDVADFPEDL